MSLTLGFYPNRIDLMPVYLRRVYLHLYSDVGLPNFSGRLFKILPAFRHRIEALKLHNHDSIGSYSNAIQLSYL